MKNRMILAVLCCALAGCGRHEPLQAPLGTLAANQVRDWQFFCEKPLVRTSVCGRDPWTPFCLRSRSPSGAFYSLGGHALPAGQRVLATHRIRCDGQFAWNVWTGEQDWILGACATPVDDLTGLERARQMLDGYLAEDDLVEAKPPDHDMGFAMPGSVLFAPGVHFWTEPVGIELHHAPDGTIIWDRSHVVPGKVAGCLEVILDD